jgi:restriction system protein
MARKKDRPAGDLMELVALLPWWAGVLLAVLSYFGLHHVASQPLPVSTQPGQITTLMTQNLWRAAALVGQYALPILCLAGAAMSAWRRHTRRQLAGRATGSDAAAAINDMSWQQFEQLVGEAFRRQGYRVTETGGGGADGGVDLVLHKGGEKHLVQCKQWRAYRVGVDIVRELYGVMAAQGAAGGFVVTSGRFTDEATRFAQGRNLRLIDGPRLRALLDAQAAPSPRAQPGAAGPAAAAPALAPVTADGAPASPTTSTTSAVTTPSCPVCDKAMIRRTAKRGAQAGNAFWGCSDYPACRGTRPAA